jgi:hypothetical protein
MDDNVYHTDALIKEERQSADTTQALDISVGSAHSTVHNH